MAPGDLQEVLAALKRPVGLSAETERNLLVGLGAADDAAVYRLAGDLAIVETVDFFPPVVDDPWTWGAVAAVNSMSDVYAMGGEGKSMLRLNRGAARVAREHGAAGATDITGFGLLGHASEMLDASRAGLALMASRLPLLEGALALAEAGHFSGGMKRNRRHVDHVLGARLEIDPTVPPTLVSILAEAETSGGLLFSIARDRAQGVVPAFGASGERCWEIG